MGKLFPYLVMEGEKCQGFPNSIKRVGEKSLLPVGEGGWEILVRVGSFSLGVENLSRSDFDDSNLFQSEKQHSVNIEHQ